MTQVIPRESQIEQIQAKERPENTNEKNAIVLYRVQTSIPCYFESLYFIQNIVYKPLRCRPCWWRCSLYTEQLNSVLTCNQHIKIIILTILPFKERS
jgi:hypothetical protein